MRVLVVFHIYYCNLAGYYLQKMSNIHSCEWDLIVTSCEPLPDDVKRSILAVKSDAAFLLAENVGYDIWPFITAVRAVNIADYDFVIKLHTKNEDDYFIKLHGINMNGRIWKEYMVEPMLGDTRRFRTLMKAFADRPSVGMAYARQLGYTSKNVNAEDCAMLDNELARLQIKRKKSLYCAGTMMAFRASALGFLYDRRITAGIFQQSGQSHSGATMAHVYERLIPIAVQAQNYTYFPLYENWQRAIHFKIKDIVTPVLEWIFSVNHYGGQETKAITVLGYRFLVKL